MKENQKISPAELSAFCNEVALVLSSGLPLFEGMEAVADGHRSAPIDLYEQAASAVVRTGSLYAALREDSRWPAYLTEMVGIGEQTGHLEEVMNGLSSFYERESRIRAAIRSALAYPMMLGGVMVLIILIMLVQVLPVFQRILGSMGINLTANGSMLVAIGTGVGWTVLILAALFICAVLSLVLLSRTKKHDTAMRFLYSVFPFMRRISTRLAASRVSSILSMMLSGGFPLDEALALIVPVLTDASAIAAVNQIRKNMSCGVSFGDAVSESGLFEEVHSRMIRMGTITGHLDEVMKKISSIYEDQVEESISYLVSIIEPTLAAMLCIVIGGILLSVVLPIAGVISSIL